MPKERDENKIKLILAATLKLVTSTGFYGLKMADVAKEAGLATGTLYIYFKNKEELITATFLTTKKEIAELLVDHSTIGANFFETFKKKWFSYYHFCLENPHKMLFVEQFIFSGIISQTQKDKAESYFNQFNSFLEEAQKHSFIKGYDINIIKSQLMGPIHEIVKAIHNNKVSASPEIIDQCFEMAWSSVRQ